MFPSGGTAGGCPQRWRGGASPSLGSLCAWRIPPVGRIVGPEASQDKSDLTGNVSDRTSSRPELSQDLQEPSELQRVADGESLPVVVEVDVNIHSVPQPFPDAAGPASQRYKREFTDRAASRL